jgi:acyl-CoA thioesterase
MSIPEHLMRYPTKEAIESLSRRFTLPNHAYVEDWEYEVADPSRLPEFISAYESGELSEDERFTLMEIVLQAFEDADRELDRDPLWMKVLTILEEEIELHICSVEYWSSSEIDLEDAWRVTPYMRTILGRYGTKTDTKESGA